jgi:2',3'-cyclic-nucleotide 2'-phosphodiesterase
MTNTIRILVFGDTVGKPGRKACRELIPSLREQHDIDLVVLNGENIAHGSSVTRDSIREILSSSVDVVTSGDHIFKKKEAYEVIERTPNLLRPLNYPKGTAGRGHIIAKARKGVKVAVINLMGRVFMPSLDCPFQAMDNILKEIPKEIKIILVDFHAEATSEKVALGWHLDGKVSAIYGTHTHVQTADETVLPKGTAYMTDLGMCGPHRSVIGRDIGQVVKRFRSQLPGPMEVAEEDSRVSGALIEINADTGKATSIKRIHEKLNGAYHV